MTLDKTRKSYMSLLMFLKRKKVENPGVLASLLFEKYVEAKQPTVYYSIKAEEIKIKKLIPTKNNPNFNAWRSGMINLGILICQANWKELKDNEANHKGSLFRFGPTVKKYIEAALAEKASVYERLDLKADIDDVQEDIDALERRMNNKISLSATKEELKDVKLELEDLKWNFDKMMLFFMPPDTEARRKIIEQYRYQQELCVQALNKEAEEARKSHLKLVE